MGLPESERKAISHTFFLGLVIGPLFSFLFLLFRNGYFEDYGAGVPDDMHPSLSTFTESRYLADSTPQAHTESTQKSPLSFSPQGKAHQIASSICLVPVLTVCIVYTSLQTYAAAEITVADRAPPQYPHPLRRFRFRQGSVD
ncbi:hypothetical protein B0J11DRAFT_579156 [Dendryphion nanum]|uniref:Uncharacterized protein n=1 Tax=Dendryphion nanum TaxID=256645 RepID=A0A9P9DU95_9PLEO|nr:hypothetical protein B0J11DRAFT_579156 [Dendryphion nanum]